MVPSTLPSILRSWALVILPSTTTPWPIHAVTRRSSTSDAIRTPHHATRRAASDSSRSGCNPAARLSRLSGHAELPSRRARLLARAAARPFIRRRGRRDAGAHAGRLYRRLLHRQRRAAPPARLSRRRIARVDPRNPAGGHSTISHPAGHATPLRRVAYAGGILRVDGADGLAHVHADRRRRRGAGRGPSHVGHAVRRTADADGPRPRPGPRRRAPRPSARDRDQRPAVARAAGRRSARARP